MALDVVDLRTFYASPLGEMTRRLVGRLVAQRFDGCCGLSMLGLGYATPYLEAYRSEALRVLAFMPAEQGVVNWPTAGRSASALVDGSAIPLPDSCIDRVLLVHALEIAEHPRELLAEVWRVLTPGGRVIAVAPSRSGLWARLDTTPFGHGQPFSRSQLRDLLRETLFSPTHWAEALYAPPFGRRLVLRSAPAFEKIGAYLALPGAGVLVVEATKQLYRPVGLRRLVRRLPQMQPVLAPQPAVGAMRSPEVTAQQRLNVRDGLPCLPSGRLRPLEAAA
jgi:SAM-dependent methyltransferase